MQSRIKAFLTAAALLFLMVIAFETHALKVEYVEVPVAGLPESFDGFRIVLVSDLHGRRFSPDGKAARAAAKANPDIIAATGDFVHRSVGDMEAVLPFLRRLTEIAPVYATSGNHEHWTNWPAIAEILDKNGINVLENRHIRIERGGDLLILAGVGDPYTGHGDLEQALPGEINSPVVLLAHSPTWFEPRYQDIHGGTPGFIRQRELLEQVSLTLVGHTHGGQIKLPFIGAVTTASGRLFPKTHVEGLSLEETGGWLYISRGMAQGGILSFRFLSRPELSVITLLAE